MASYSTQGPMRPPTLASVASYITLGAEARYSTLGQVVHSRGLCGQLLYSKGLSGQLPHSRGLCGQLLFSRAPEANYSLLGAAVVTGFTLGPMRQATQF